MDHPPLTSRLVTPKHCAHLRHKGMYVTTVGDPEEATFYDRYDATAYWCTHTQKDIGPDGMPVHTDACVEGRECCRQ